jgi:hypothetical protein
MRYGAGLLLTACVLAMAGCPAPPQPTKDDMVQARVAVGREHGRAAAESDIRQGILRLKEYPPMPYSLQQMKYIKLLKSEHDIGWMVVPGPPDSKDLREEVAAYNALMEAEIERRFGAGTLQKLREKAEEK